ncbi:hypothetical protein PV721_23920 [Streptomyces sp. MB09-01]|uniref:hypothetical protein n=1 Tax=Streptomyces sp. MB09-01 TaxID=3028666 RepID=UPI0029AA8D5F|nr:hypothetical protein [Streptomyces sp. MB09-01]MDX3537368.1 hypothetical protein [Streptomyces sp. MB09-01]
MITHSAAATTPGPRPRRGSALAGQRLVREAHPGLHTPAPAPPGPEEGDGPGLVFEWRLPDDGRPAEAQAAAAVERLESTDPTTYATLTGGNRELAESLGYAWPRRN